MGDSMRKRDWVPAAALSLALGLALACAACSPAASDVRAGDGAAGPQALRDDDQAASDGGAGDDGPAGPVAPSFTVVKAEAVDDAGLGVLEDCWYAGALARFPDGFGDPGADEYGRAVGSAPLPDSVGDVVASYLQSLDYGRDVSTLLSCEVEKDFGVAWGVRYEFEHLDYIPQKGEFSDPVRYERRSLVFDSSAYDWSGDVMGTRDPTLMKRALDQSMRSDLVGTASYCVLASGIREGASGTRESDAAWKSPDDAVERPDGPPAGGWTYRVYVVKTVLGDWGLADRATLSRYSVRIDAATGTVSQPEETVIASATGSWGGFGDVAMW